MNKMLDLKWDTIFEEVKDDINQVWDIFMQHFNAAERECIPKRIIKTGVKKFSHRLDKKTLATRKKKYRLWKRYSESKDFKIYEEYCRCRNQLRRMTRKIAKNQEEHIAKGAKTNNKAFWKFVNSKTKLRSQIPELYTSKQEKASETTSDDSQKANILGDFFSSVYVKEPDWIWVLNEESKPNIREELKLDISLAKVKEKLEGLKINKSPGPDGQHPRVLKEIADTIAYPLWYIFNLSLKTGKIPDAWKLATVSPIFKKKGSKMSPGNYRPVSLTSIASKIMQSIIRDSLLLYLKENSILSNKQFGFLGGRSTILQLLQVTDRWVDILDRGGVIDTIYCDFQKAFDTVPHRRLLTLLTHYGIKDPLLSWIEDFLTNRKQQVQVNGKMSKIFDVLSGVPQGSVLGPVLFIIFINSMVELVKDSEMFLYADDLKLFKEIITPDDAEALQGDLDILYDWSNYSLLHFHPDKCVSMRLKQNTREPPVNCFYNMDATRLKVVNVEKDLGVIIDSSLSFDEHISTVVKKANSLMGMIRRSFLYLDKDMFRRLFTAIVRPHLEYGAPIWNPHFKKHIDLIESVQRRATKLIPGLFDLSYKERLKLLKLPTLEYRRYRGDMIELYKMTHGLYDNGATQNFLSFTPSHCRGHKFNLEKSYSKKDIRRFSFRHRTTNQWNNLPTKVPEADNINLFKKYIDQLWEHDDIMYDPDVNIYIRTSLRRNRYVTIIEDDE